MKRILLIIVWLASASGIFAQAPQEKPGLILTNRNVLYRVKQSIVREEPEVMPAFEALIERADKALSQGPYTVMSKKQTPPSGNKHDYVSRGPYWWADPSKPDGLPYIRKDGLRNPECNDFTDRSNLEKVVEGVRNLGLAYYFTEDERYARHASLLLRTWFLDEETKMNPNLNYGQQIPGITDGRGIGIIDTRGLAYMLDAVILLQDSGAWTETDDKELRQWFGAFVKWLKESPLGKDEESQHNNHGTYYDLQVVAYSVYSGNHAAAVRQLEEVTTRRIDSQIRPDGEMPFEMARTRPWGYCTMNLHGFVSLAFAAEKLGVDLWNYENPEHATLRTAIEWYLPFINGEKEWPKEEITGGRSAGSLVSSIYIASRYNKKMYKEMAEKAMAFCGDNFDLASSEILLTYPIFEGTVTDDSSF